MRTTPVFGTTLPPRGLSGAVRRAVYRIPEHRARHWLLLLLADRLDRVEQSPTGQRLANPAVIVGTVLVGTVIGLTVMAAARR